MMYVDKVAMDVIVFVLQLYFDLLYTINMLKCVL